MNVPGPIPPHGGRLVTRFDDSLVDVPGRPRLAITPRQQADLDLIGVGAFSPLEGFMDKVTYNDVVEGMRLPNGLAWSIPITLAVSDEKARELSGADTVALTDEDDHFLGILELEEIYDIDLSREARLVFGTDEQEHPGVAALYAHGSKCLAGPVRVAERMPLDAASENYRLDPLAAREKFDSHGWKTVVGFQTRNPIHRAHEYITKVALETVEGLFIHPLVGETKSDDIPPDVRMRCYETLIDGYYAKDRVQLGVLPAAMRYAGPREAILHAIMRQNYGCTHFIVGRDHAGVGSYYGTYDAQHIFEGISIPEELGITPMMFEHSFWCTRTGGMATSKTSPSGPDERIFLSGTKVREMLEAGEAPPEEFTRPEVAKILIEAAAG
jgi:sulfate adenylyltransferase